MKKDGREEGGEGGAYIYRVDQANSRQASVFVFNLDLDSDNISKISEYERNRSPGSEADTWTQSMLQTIRHSMN